MQRMVGTALVALFAAWGACNSKDGGDGAEVACENPGELRLDPASGQCIPECGVSARFSWPSCEGSCAGLDEEACRQAAGCAVVLVEACPGCTNLDATCVAIEDASDDDTPCADLFSASECLARDDCTARYQRQLGCDPVDDTTTCGPTYASCGPEYDACRYLRGTTFYSLTEGECGLGPEGPVYCTWQIWFEDNGTFEFHSSDVIESGSYDCDGAMVTTGPSDASYQGSYDFESGILTWGGREYSTDIPE